MTAVIPPSVPEETDDLVHVARTQLPWRTDPPITECGLSSDRYPTISRDELVAKVKRIGVRRGELATCITCWQTTQRHYRSEHASPLLAVLARELERFGPWSRRHEERDRLTRELTAITMLVDAAVDGLADTPDLNAKRAAKRASRTYGRRI